MSLNFRNTHHMPLQLTGRSMPLIYKLVSALVSRPCLKAVVVIDTEKQFDPTRLAAPSVPDTQTDADDDDFDHVYVFQPAQCSPERVRELVMRSEEWMLYGDHGSRAREWWGIIVIGGPVMNGATQHSSGQGPRHLTVDVTAGWKGWMRVDRQDVPGYPVGASAAEALENRHKRQIVVDEALWMATCHWGDFTFAEGR